MEEFREEGIDKITQLFSDDITLFAYRLDALVLAGRGYETFSGLADGMNGKVKFIIRTDSIGEE